MMTGPEDIAYLPIVDRIVQGDRYALFVGAIQTAERLGYRVEVRTIRDTLGVVHSLVAAASTPHPEPR